MYKIEKYISKIYTIQYNTIMNEELLKYLLSCISTSTNFISFEIFNRDIDDDFLECLEHILNTKIITHIRICNAHIEDTMFERIINLIKNSPAISTIKSLTFCHGRITSSSFLHLLSLLRINTTITDINLGNNSINNAGGLDLIDVLKNNTTITSVIIGHNSINQYIMVKIQEKALINLFNKVIKGKNLQQKCVDTINKHQLWHLLPESYRNIYNC